MREGTSARLGDAGAARSAADTARSPPEAGRPVGDSRAPPGGYPSFRLGAAGFRRARASERCAGVPGWGPDVVPGCVKCIALVCSAAILVEAGSKHAVEWFWTLKVSHHKRNG
jgi:hypothetical protein